MPRPTEAVIVRHPEAALMVALDPAVDYASDDVLVAAYPWAFAPKRHVPPVESVQIEQATQAPGEKRSRRK